MNINTRTLSKLNHMRYVGALLLASLVSGPALADGMQSSKMHDMAEQGTAMKMDDMKQAMPGGMKDEMQGEMKSTMHGDMKAEMKGEMKDGMHDDMKAGMADSAMSKDPMHSGMAKGMQKGMEKGMTAGMKDRMQSAPAMKMQ